MFNELNDSQLAELLKQKLAEQNELRKKFEAASPAEEYKDDINLDETYRQITEFRMDRETFLVKHIRTELLSQWPVMTGPKRLKISVETWVDEIHATFPLKNQTE